MRIVLPLSITAAMAALLAACNAYGEPPAGAGAATASGGRQCIYTPNIRLPPRARRYGRHQHQQPRLL